MTTVFNDSVEIMMKTVADPSGLPYSVNAMELLGNLAVLEVKEGPPGTQGDEGSPSWPWVWQGDVPNVAVLTALEAAGLGPEEAGYAWHIVDQNRIRIWTGSEWVSFYNAFRQPGREGPANVLDATAVNGGVGSNAAATLTGSAPNQVLNITWPQGVAGDVGNPGLAGDIRDAPDFDADADLFQDMVLIWDTAKAKYVPGPNPAWGGPWALGSSQFNAGSNINTIPKTLATLTVPGQGSPWRPYVSGGVSLQSHVRTLGQSRIDIEIRMGSADGQLVGYGVGFASANWLVSRLFPKFDAPLFPGSEVGVVPANVTTTFYVVTARPFGSANYSINTDAAQLIVYATPVYNP